MNLFRDIRNNYGQSVVKDVRELETIEKKIARQRNHLVYTLRCKQSEVTPPSLRLRCPVKTNNALRIVKRAELQLMNERIRCINNKVSQLRCRAADIDLDLNNRLPPEYTGAIHQRVKKSGESEFNVCKQRQVNKFDRLLEKRTRTGARFIRYAVKKMGC